MELILSLRVVTLKGPWDWGGDRKSLCLHFTTEPSLQAQVGFCPYSGIHSCHCYFRNVTLPFIHSASSAFSLSPKEPTRFLTSVTCFASLNISKIKLLCINHKLQKARINTHTHKIPIKGHVVSQMFLAILPCL